MKEVTIENVKARIALLEGTERACGLTLKGDFELACLRQLVELEAKCAALAAENAAMHETIEAVRSVADNSSGIAGWHLNGDIATWEEILPEINDIETPSTDAFLAEVRAQGLNAFIQHRSAELDAHIKNGGEQFDEKSVRIRDIIVSARLFREQIRKGVQS